MNTVLILTQRFFPDPVAGAVRMTQWARTLPRYGWKPIIACRNYGFKFDRQEFDRLVHPDAELVYLNELPQEDTARERARELRTSAVRVFGTGVVGRDPTNPLLSFAKGVATRALAARAQAADAAFWRQTYGRVYDLVRTHNPQVVVTSSPPIGVHKVGRLLRADFPGILWLADFRDDFRQGGRYRVGLLERPGSYLALKTEAGIYRQADQITCATPTQHRWIRKRFSADAYKSNIVLNGVPEELRGQESVSADAVGDGFAKVVGFADAYETVLLAKAISTVRNAGSSIRLKFVGRPPSVRNDIEAILGGAVEFHGSVRHDQALAEITSASVLVAVLSESRSRIPAIASKLFEYLAVAAPVIVINPSTTARTLFGRLAGVWMVSRPTSSDIEQALVAALQTPKSQLYARARLVQEKWSRASQVAQLASILDTLVEGRVAGASASKSDRTR